MNNHDSFPLREPWLSWAMELQSIAQNGLTYTDNEYDIERYERIRQIAAEMMSVKTAIPIEKVTSLFCGETGYQTPKMDTRAAVFQNGKVLLVHEKNGTWSLPGGWVDVLESVGTNTVKEVREEAGLEVAPRRLIALQDRNRHNTPPYAYGICKVFVLCDLIGGTFHENIETIEIGWFALDALPRLAEEKCTAAQIALCFKAAADENWQPVFD